MRYDGVQLGKVGNEKRQKMQPWEADCITYSQGAQLRIYFISLLPFSVSSCSSGCGSEENVDHRLECA